MPDTKSLDFDKSIQEAIEYCRPIVFKNFNISNQDYNDAQQNAVIKAVKYLPSFQGDSSFNTWFYRIVKNEALSIIKENRKRDKEIVLNVCPETLSILEKFYVDKETPSSLLLSKEEKADYKKLLKMIYKSLGPYYGKIIKLLIEKNKSYKEIAKELDVNLGTVMSGVFYAKKKTQKIIRFYKKFQSSEED